MAFLGGPNTQRTTADLADERIPASSTGTKRKRSAAPSFTSTLRSRARARRRCFTSNRQSGLEAYTYPKLDRDKKQFRLLGFSHLGWRTNPAISPYRLYTFDFDKAPPYDAVSYAWGKTQHILMALGRKWLPVPESASHALNYLCHEAVRSIEHGDVAFLWIDSICINQQDLDEKSLQVAFMADIYCKADNVLVFVGLPVEGDEHLLRSAKKAVGEVQRYYGEDRDDLMKALHRSVRASRVPPLPPFPFGGLSIAGMNQLFRSDWFRRLWVMQEVYLSKRSRAFYGPLSIDLDALITLGRWKHKDNLETGLKSSPALKRCEALLRASSNCTMGHLGPCRKGYCNDGEALSYLLQLTRKAISRDPRDKLYAVLGLCKEETAVQVQPDYTRSVAEVYTRAMRLCIWEEASYKELCEAYCGRGRELSWCQDKNWPTWVPSWSGRRTPVSTHQFCTNRRTNVRVQLDALDDPVLCLQGILLDIVAWTQPNHGNFSSANFGYRHDRAPRTKNRYQQLLQGKSSWGFGDSLFVTEGGYECTCSSIVDVQAGDAICIPYGSEDAFLLRPVESSHFLFIGCCRQVGSITYDDLFEDDQAPRLSDGSCVVH